MASSAGFHEAEESLTPETRDIHRAIVSLQEELEAIDWYSQRIDAADDAELQELLAHNRDEEKEHAAMLLEWIRRRDGAWDAMLRRYLFTDQPILAIEEGAGTQATTPSPVAPGDLRIRDLQGGSTL